MYQAYIPGRGPFTTLFPFPVAHPAPVRPNETFLTQSGLITSTGHPGAPILSIPSVAALRAKVELDNAQCLDLVKRNNNQQTDGKSNNSSNSPKKVQPVQVLNQQERGPGAEFTKFTIDEILGKGDDLKVKQDISDDEVSGDEIEVVRCNSHSSDGEQERAQDGLEFPSNNTDAGDPGVDDPSTRFSWLQCTRYKPPKLPRK